MPDTFLSASIDDAIEKAIRESVADRKQPVIVAEKICQILDDVIDGNETLQSRSVWSARVIRELLQSVEASDRPAD